MRHYEMLARIILPLPFLAMGCGFGLAEAQVFAPSLGPYGRLDSYCGTGRIPQDVATIPWIGCVYLSAGHGARGTFWNHNVEIAVGADGREAFTVDGTSITETHSPQRTASGTNMPFVRVGGVDGYWICQGTSGAACPSDITIFSRNPDKSVLFMVSECLAPTYHLCVTTRENWNYEKSRQP